MGKSGKPGSNEALKEECRRYGLTVPSKARKHQLQALIDGHKASSPLSDTPLNLDAILLTSVTIQGSDIDGINDICRNQLMNQSSSATTDWGVPKPRWGNAPGLGVLERLDQGLADIRQMREDNRQMRQNFQEVLESNQAMREDNRQMRAQIDAISTITPAIRNRFLSVYNRNVGLGPAVKLHSIQHGNTAAHDGHALADADLYDRRHRQDEETYRVLYGLNWSRVFMSYATNQEILRLLERHATVLAQKASQQLDVPALFETTFQEFIQSLEAGGYRSFFLHEPNASETLAYYRFWKEDKLVI